MQSNKAFTDCYFETEQRYSWGKTEAMEIWKCFPKYGINLSNNLVLAFLMFSNKKTSRYRIS